MEEGKERRDGWKEVGGEEKRTEDGGININIEGRRERGSV